MTNNKSNFKTIPANSGFYLVSTVEPSPGSSKVSLYRDPILAWKIDVNETEFVRPVTLSGREDRDESFLVETPLKTFELIGSRSWEDEAELMDYLEMD